jgi:hypothetical protein
MRALPLPYSTPRGPAASGQCLREHCVYRLPSQPTSNPYELLSSALIRRGYLSTSVSIKQHYGSLRSLLTLRVIPQKPCAFSALINPGNMS